MAGKLHNPTWRVLSALNHISSHKGVTLAECSEDLGIPVGTLYPILQTLVQMGYSEYDENTRKYYTGLRLFLAGSAYDINSNGYASIEKIIKVAAEKCGGETFHFAKLDGGNVLYIIKVESTQSVRTYSSVGLTIPAYGTALGKALLSGISHSEIKALYPEGLKAITKNTITSFDTLYSQLESIRKTGFAYESEESNYDVCCIAKPLFSGGRVVASISVAMPIFRYNDEKKALIESELSHAALQIEQFLPFMDI